jgi:hypothetical protein
MAIGLLLLAAFVPLFDGKSLTGWNQCNGTAKYSAEDGAIVGTTVEGSPNSFLCSDREFGDFVLEFEVKMDPALNSGVQIRAQRYAKQTGRYPAGRVHGYQVEIAREQSGESGGIFDEARRDWLQNTKDRPDCKAAYKDGQWNKYRVEAIGDRIRTWVNGAPCADIVDAMDLTGPLALQVHSHKGPPVQVRWRNIRLEDRGRHVWRPLFDGTSLKGWQPRGGGKFTVHNGAIYGVNVDDDPRIGYIVSDESFRDVTTRIRFRIPKGNSGFFVRTDPETLAAYEVEIDATKRTGGLWETRGRNWVAGPEDNAGVKPDDWNEIVASLHGDRIVFKLNGKTTLELPDDKQGRKEGRLALQVHGAKNPSEVWIQSIEVLVPSK